jgi:hypothetical protein
MKPKLKANNIYNSAVELHGEQDAKEQAIKSAEAIKALAPFEVQHLWNEVIILLESK